MSDKRDPATDSQQAPIANDRPFIQDMVIADIEERKQFGIAKYGTALQAHNGRNPIRDAYEEALDMAIYLRQALEEQDPAASPSLTVEVPTLPDYPRPWRVISEGQAPVIDPGGVQDGWTSWSVVDANGRCVLLVGDDEDAETVATAIVALWNRQ